MSLTKTIVATGASSGVGFEAIKQLLNQSTQPYKVILGVRDPRKTKAAYDAAGCDLSGHKLAVLALDLSDLSAVRSFSRETLEELGDDRLDYLFLNAAANHGAERPGLRSSRWTDSYIVNHLSHHYLVHLLRDKLEASRSRVIFTSSGAVAIPELDTLDKDLLANSGAPALPTLYIQTKFVQLLGVHWWRRQLDGVCKVLAVSPGLVPGTTLGRLGGQTGPSEKTIPEGGASLLRAFWVDDFPDDPEQVFFTSWGEWWSKDVFAKTLDRQLQEKWCPSKEEIEREEGLV